MMEATVSNLSSLEKMRTVHAFIMWYALIALTNAIGAYYIRYRRALYLSRAISNHNQSQLLSGEIQSCLKRNSMSASNVIHVLGRYSSQ